jgi:hypothetical protein
MIKLKARVDRHRKDTSSHLTHVYKNTLRSLFLVCSSSLSTIHLNGLEIQTTPTSRNLFVGFRKR